MPDDSAFTLAGDVQLRNVIEDDLPIFYEQQCDSEALRMAAFAHRESAAFLAQWKKILSDETVSARTILAGDQVAGNIVSWACAGQQLVGYWIGRNYWGKGVATQALRAFLGIVHARPLRAHVARHNIASIRVLEKCGFAISDQATAALCPPGDGIEELVFMLADYDGNDRR